MKALASAEKEKKEKELQHQALSETPNAAVALSLTPIEHANTDSSNTSESIGNIDQPATNNAVHGQPLIVAGNKKSDPSVSTGNSSQKAAANIFMAGKQPKSYLSTLIWALLGVVFGLFIWLVLQIYRTQNSEPEVFMAQKNTPQLMITDAEDYFPVQTPALTDARLANENTHLELTKNLEKNEIQLPYPIKANRRNNQPSVTQKEVNPEISLFEPQTANEHGVIQATPQTRTIDTPQTSQSASLSITANRQSALSIDPTLLAAYQAFTRGENTEAQQQYRRVLQKNVRNVDALLGMAAIAQRQARNADAIGWYQKVLEVEPNNNIALGAMLNMQPNTESGNQISQLKSLIAQQPEVASFHAALGNQYAAQNQWLQAQEAYFNANRYAPNNADYAFNLAISLDQLGKSQLALMQYQRALALVEESGATSPDKNQIKTRIQTLQQ
jgi:tetratricopeptide (TPR) repeat protein